MEADFLRGLTLTYIICIGDVFVTDRWSCSGALDKATLTGYWVTPLHGTWYSVTMQSAEYRLDFICTRS